MEKKLLKRISLLCALAALLCLAPAAGLGDGARIPLSAGELDITDFEVSSSMEGWDVFSLPDWEWVRPLLRGGRRLEGAELAQLLGTSKTAAAMLGEVYYEGLSRSAGFFFTEKDHAVYVPLSADPFRTGLPLAGAAVILRENGNNGGWYVSSASAVYETDKLRGIIARYRADMDMTLICYSLFNLADRVMYLSHYPPLGGYWEAWALDEMGSRYKSIPSYDPYRWYDTEARDFVRTPRLAVPEDLAVERLW